MYNTYGKQAALNCLEYLSNLPELKYGDKKELEIRIKAMLSYPDN
jgi:hypothetical protein